MKTLRKIIGAALVASSLLTCAQASQLGIDLGGNPSGYYVNASDAWSLGYKFSVANSTTVDGLGFWDVGNGYNATTVGLWTGSGTLLGTVSSSSSAVTSFATANGHGTWNFMSTSINLTAGSYIVGAWGAGMEYTFSSAEPFIESGLTHLETREKYGFAFQLPTDNLYGNNNAFYGGNVSFGTAAVPDAGSTIALLGAAFLGLGLIRRRSAA